MERHAHVARLDGCFGIGGAFFVCLWTFDIGENVWNTQCHAVIYLFYDISCAIVFTIEERDGSADEPVAA